MPELAGIFLGEEFYWIPTYKPRYSLSKSAKIYDHNLNCLLVIGQRKAKYIAVSLRGSDGKKKTISVHRLVAATFLGLDLSNPEIQVDHINKVVSDNNVSNLRLCTRKQNMLWAHGSGSLDTDTHKQCRRCKIVKPRTEFTRETRGGNYDAHRPYCKSCKSEMGIEFQARQLQKEKQRCQ